MKTETMWGIAHKIHGLYTCNFALTRVGAWRLAEKMTGNNRESLKSHGDFAVKVKMKYSAPKKPRGKV